jgi:hypothetical protein
MSSSQAENFGGVSVRPMSLRGTVLESQGGGVEIRCRRRWVVEVRFGCEIAWRAQVENLCPAVYGRRRPGMLKLGAQAVGKEITFQTGSSGA